MVRDNINPLSYQLEYNGENMDIKIGDRVELMDTTNLDKGLEVGQQGSCNAAFEDVDGSRYVMFQPADTMDFIWMAAWRFKVLED